jgi:hypothetical protein
METPSDGSSLELTNANLTALERQAFELPDGSEEASSPLGEVDIRQLPH